MRIFKSAFFVCVGIIIFLPSLSLAEVDGDTNSVEKDRSHFGAKETVRKSTKYQIYDLASAYHNVHEYVDKNGHVFAVTWDGRITPNLSVIFGKHYAEYRRELAQVHREKGRRNFQSLSTSKLKIVQTGHLGHWMGSAILTGQLPKDTTTEQILKDTAEN
jgi:Protein of unknown function (DUF2844)